MPRLKASLQGPHGLWRPEERAIQHVQVQILAKNASKGASEPVIPSEGGLGDRAVTVEDREESWSGLFHEARRGVNLPQKRSLRLFRTSQ